MMQLPSQKDKSGKKDSGNQKAMNLLYKKNVIHLLINPIIFFGAACLCKI
jgi:hypothetical protein